MPDRYWVAGGTGNYNSTTNWSATSGGASGASVPTSADNVFFNASSGAGTATINVASNCANLNLTGFTGTLAFTNTLQVNGTVLNLGTGGYTVTGASQLLLATAMTVTSNGTNYQGNIYFAANVTYTLADNLTILGTLSITAGGNQTVNGNSIFISSNLTSVGNGTTSGTTAFVFNGTGTWSHTSTGVIRNNTTINTAGTLTIGTNIYYNTGTLTYTAGTVVTTGSTLNISVATTLNTNGITWNNITTSFTGAITLSSNLTLTGTLSLTSGTLSFTLGGNSLVSTNANLSLAGATFTMPANQTFKSLTTSGIPAINTNTLTLTENLTINGNPTGTTSIVYAGTGTWSGSGFLGNTFTINTAGTLTITGTVNKSGGTFTYTAGTVNDAGATVVVSSATTLNVSGKTWNKLLVSGVMTLTSNINATTFGTTSTSNTSFVLGGNSINFTNLELGNTGTTTLPTAWTCTNIEFTNGSAGTLNGNSITINGNILQSGTGAYSGTTTFTYAGTGTWNRTNTGYFSNSFTINTAGTLTITGGNIGGGIFTYTAGTVITTGGTLWNRVTGTTFNHGAIIFNNVVFGASEGSGSVPSVTLNNKLTCTGTLTLGISNTTFAGTDGTFDVFNLILGTDNTALRTTSLISTKTYLVRQSLTCTQATDANRILMQSTIGGSKAIFTVFNNSTLNVGFVNATDIDSSLGKRIYSYRGVFSNTDNWALLPTDVKSATGVFVN